MRRLPLGVSPRRLSFERRVRLWLLAFCVSLAVLAGLLGWSLTQSFWTGVGFACVAAVLSALAASALFAQIVRPLQTLSNIIVALRENDFTLRVRGGRRGDALGDLALETNMLAATLQQQRTQARDAVTLAERVITAMPSPVLAFSESGRLCLLNRAAELLLKLPREQAVGHTAEELGLQVLLQMPDGGVFAPQTDGFEQGPGLHAPVLRWSVRRTSFRLEGVPHTLLICSDVDAALREEERTAWQRLIRVLGHEINNSLAPISSIAGSLRTRLPRSGSALETDLHRGLAIIEDRAGALHRFLVAYQQISRLPSPDLQRFELGPLLERVAVLETRLTVEMEPGPAVTLRADPDQLQQMFINLLRNAVDAALQGSAQDQPRVQITWNTAADEVVVRVRDNGAGVANPRNLFVPFYTTKPQGSGIGLVLVRQIVSAHGGVVSLVSRTDVHGCDALVHLPLQPPSSGSA